MHNAKPISIMALTLFLGLMFSITPMPLAISPGRPLLGLLIVMYWVLYCPDHVGVATAWVIGFLTDFMYGVILGPYALAFSVVAYTTLRIHARLLMFPMFQQVMFVGMMTAGVQLFVIGLGLLVGRMTMTWPVLWSIGTTALCWPVVVVILDSARGLFSQVE